MSITPVPISIRLVETPIAASSGEGEESWRAKWWTRTNAPSMPISSAATASSTVWRNASAPVCVAPPPGCQAPNERKPIFFAIPQYNVIAGSSISAVQGFVMLRGVIAAGHRVLWGGLDLPPPEGPGRSPGTRPPLAHSAVAPDRERHEDRED